jgi:hypothetical protein
MAAIKSSDGPPLVGYAEAPAARIASAMSLSVMSSTVNRFFSCYERNA